MNTYSSKTLKKSLSFYKAYAFGTIQKAVEHHSIIQLFSLKLIN